MKILTILSIPIKRVFSMKKKSKIIKKKKWLKNRRREKKNRKQQNYGSKTHKGTGPFNLTQNLIRREQEEKEQKETELKIRKKILG